MLGPKRKQMSSYHLTFVKCAAAPFGTRAAASFCRTPAICEAAQRDPATRRPPKYRRLWTPACALPRKPGPHASRSLLAFLSSRSGAIRVRATQNRILDEALPPGLLGAADAPDAATIGIGPSPATLCSGRPCAGARPTPPHAWAAASRPVEQRIRRRQTKLPRARDRHCRIAPVERVRRTTGRRSACQARRCLDRKRDLRREGAAGAEGAREGRGKDRGARVDLGIGMACPGPL